MIIFPRLSRYAGVSLLALLLPTGVCAQSITISPASPTTRDAVVVKLNVPAQLWEPRASKVSMAANKITVSFYNPCIITIPTGGMTSAPQELSVGRLPIGRYEIEVTQNTCAPPTTERLVGTVSLEVTDPPYLQPGSRGMHDFTDIWWASAESGWGISIHSKGVNVFAAWFVYSQTRVPIWYTLQGGSWTTVTTYSGKVYQSSGSYFGGNFDVSTGTASVVGTGTLTFSSYERGTLEFTVNGTTVKKEITRTPL
jgi:hypothetical protein